MLGVAEALAEHNEPFKPSWINEGVFPDASLQNRFAVSIKTWKNSFPHLRLEGSCERQEELVDHERVAFPVENYQHGLSHS